MQEFDNQEDLSTVYIISGIEYVRTGRVAEKKTRRRTRTLHELVPLSNIDDIGKEDLTQVAKWVKIESLFVVKDDNDEE